MSARARNFILANELSPVVYHSIDEAEAAFRLANGKMFRMTVEEARQIPKPRWAYLEREAHPTALKEYSQAEAETLKSVLLEALS
jgi:hypothetical protein